MDRSWLTAEWTSLWHNNAGGSGALVEISAGSLPGEAFSVPSVSLLISIGFIAQTPNDDWPFCSLSVTTLGYGTGGVFIADKNIDINALLQNQCYGYNPSLIMDFLLLPIRLLEWHVSYTGRRLTELQRKVTKIETQIAPGRGRNNLQSLVLS